MTPSLTVEAWARVSAWFETGRDMAVAEQGAWLDALSDQHPDLAPWLRQMLAAHAERRTDDWLERGPQLGPGAAASGAPEDGPQAGARVGPWVLLERLGAGGMAHVWRAVRADALPAREVALKLPLADGAAAGAAGASRFARQLAERFAREQDILSRLEHPHIARLYDAGVAPDGTPWLAMECVHGERIDAWCHNRRLGVRGRLALFAQVLGAVQYAHARLVIHRDLKPSNILVDDVGQVRLLDFGIARLLDGPEDGANGTGGVDVGGDAEGATALTRAAGRVMTPAYAAPEQVRGQTLTTAVDVYSLGVVLFELLAGASPYRLKIDSPAQLEQAIAADDVQRASSTATAAAAAAQGSSLRALRRALAGDVDTVLAKALAHDPSQRYASAAAFADDIARHLGGRPVAAQRGAALYRLRKWVGRHRWQAAAASAVVAALLLGTGLASWQARVATQERNAAQAEAARSSAINFFFSDLLEQAARNDAPVNGPQLLTRAEALARSEFNGRGDELAAVFFSVAMVHQSQGRTAEARRLLEEAQAAARDPAFRNDVACDLAVILEDHVRATAMLTAVANEPTTSARSRSACLVYLGDLLRGSDPAQALRRYQQALADWERSASRSPYDRITILGRLAFAQALLGHTAQAAQEFEAALVQAEALGREGAGMGSALRNRLGRAWLIAGAPERALPLFERNLAEHARSRPGALAPADSLINQGQALLDMGHAAQALVSLQVAAQSASAGGNRAQQAQALCLARWALARGGPGAAGPSSPEAQPGGAEPATTDALTRATCALARAQVLAAQADWPAAAAELSDMLGRPAPEPQWALDARLLRAEAALQAGRRDVASAEARLALAEARRLQDGAPDGARARQAQALLDTAGRQ